MPIGTEQWRAATGAYFGNLSAVYRLYGSRRVCKGPKVPLTVHATLNGLYGLFAYVLASVSVHRLYPMWYDFIHAVSSCVNCLWKSVRPAATATISVFRGCCSSLRLQCMPSSVSVSSLLRLLLALNWLLIVAGDVELNPGPVPPRITELLPTVDASILTEEDLSDVFDAVESLAMRWQGMCIRLGLLSSDIDTIAAMYPHNPTDCLMEVLNKWFKMAYDTQKHGPPSWQKVVAAVANTTGGNNPALAQTIAECHQGTTEIAGQRRDGGITGGYIPLLRELDQLPVSPVWYLLGLQLGVSADDLDVIEKIYPRDTDMCKVKMFSKWLRIDTNPTYEKLIKALAAVGKKNLAESVCVRQGISKSILDAVELHQSSNHEKYLAACKAAMEKKGKLKQTYIPCVFVGPPDMGKTSLMRRLIGDPANSLQCLPSTGVAEKVRQRKIEHLTATASKSAWNELTLDEEAVTLLMDISSEVSSHTDTDTSSGQQSQSQSDAENSTQPSQSQSDDVGNSILPSSFIPPLQMFKNALLASGWSAAHEYLEGACIVYLTDTGGQLEFQELLPALVSGPSVFFLVFRLDRNLNEKFTVEYRHSNKGHSKEYASSYTIKEYLLHTLASIASIGSYRCKGVLKKSLKPTVFFVGTHKDEVLPPVEEKIEKIDRDLFQAVECYYASGIIEKADEDHLILTVNNLSHDDSDAQQVRAAVERIRGIGNYDVTAPPQWLIFSLALRQLKESILTYEDCSAVAKQCGIETSAELNDVLGFLSTQLGLVRHFQGADDKDLKEIVIQDPQILFNKITDLIVETFTFNNVESVVYDEFKKQGIFRRSVFEELSCKEGAELLTPSRLLGLLQHLHIIAKVSGVVKAGDTQSIIDGTKEDGEINYFMPCILTHAPVANPNSSDSQVPPLLVCFSCGYPPRGLFYSLAVYFLNSESKFPWELNREELFRDQIKFFRRPYYDIMLLKVTPRCIEVHCTPGPSYTPASSHVNTVCKEARQTIESGIRDVAHTLHYYDKAKYSVALFCPRNHPAEIFSNGLSCSSCRTAYPFPPNCEVWINEGNQVLRDGESTSHEDDVNPKESKDKDGSQRLDLKDLYDVCKEVHGVRAHWQTLGGILKVDPATLGAISVEHHNNPDDCLRDTLTHWLKQVNPLPTWEAIVDALCSPMMNQAALAETIKAKYCPGNGDDGGNGHGGGRGGGVAVVGEDKLPELMPPSEHFPMSSGEASMPSQTTTVKISRSTTLSSPPTTTGTASPTQGSLEAQPIVEWLTTYKLQEYVSKFEAHGYDTAEFLAGITKDELSELGVQKIGHMNKILTIISAMPARENFLGGRKPSNVPVLLQLLSLSQYETILLEAGYDDINYITNITAEDLSDVGISNKAHLRRFMKGIAELREVMKTVTTSPSHEHTHIGQAPQ